MDNLKTTAHRNGTHGRPGQRSARRWAAAVALPVFLWTGAAAGGAGSGAPAADELARVELAVLDGGPATLADHRGRVIVLNFWATWCVPCLREMPVLSDLQARYGGLGLTVIGASADPPDRMDRVRRFVRRHRPGFPIWTGATTRDMERLGLGEALPATALIDRDGRIAARFIGPFDEAVIESRVEWLLGDRTAPAPGHALVVAPSSAGGPEAEPGAAAEGHDHGHHHGGEEEHAHGGVGIEGASLVPS